MFCRKKNFLRFLGLVENYSGRFLVQIQSTLFIPAIVSRREQSYSVNFVTANQCVGALLLEFPRTIQVSSGSSACNMWLSMSSTLEMDARPVIMPVPCSGGKE